MNLEEMKKIAVWLTYLVTVFVLVNCGASMDTYRYIKGNKKDKIAICTLIPKEKLYSKNKNIKDGLTKLSDVFANNFNKNFKTQVFNSIGDCPSESGWFSNSVDKDKLVKDHAKFITIQLEEKSFRPSLWSSIEDKETDNRRNELTYYDQLAIVEGVPAQLKAERLTKEEFKLVPLQEEQDNLAS